MYKKPHIYALVFLSSCMPLLASAQLNSTQNLLRAAEGIVSQLILLASAAALLYFIWGLAKFIHKASEGDTKEGKSIMLWGILSLFVLVSVYGIINFIASDLGISQTGVLHPGTQVGGGSIDTNVPFQSDCSDTNPDNPC